MYKYSTKKVIINGRQINVYIPTKAAKTGDNNSICINRITIGLMIGFTLLATACIALAYMAA